MFLGLAAVQFYGFYWMKLYFRFRNQLWDEERFHRFSCAAYVRAFSDCMFFAGGAEFDRYCRKYIDHLPGVNRNFYHQEDIFYPPYLDIKQNMQHARFANNAPWAPWYGSFMGG